MTALNFERFAAVVNHLDAPADRGNDGERLNALDMACRMLRDAGLTWSDVLRVPNPPETAQPETMRPEPANAFAGLFDHLSSSFVERARQAKQAQEAAARRRRYVTGADLPAHLSGAVKVAQDSLRDTRNGRMVTISIEFEGTTYGPMNVFDDDAIHAMMNGDNAWFEGAVRQSKSDRWLPTFEPGKARGKGAKA